MTREDAERLCSRLAAEHPDRETHRWQPREDPGGGWSMVKIALPPAAAAGGAEVGADERPPTPDDPRPAANRNIPPFPGA